MMDRFLVGACVALGILASSGCTDRTIGATITSMDASAPEDALAALDVPDSSPPEAGTADATAVDSDPADQTSPDPDPNGPTAGAIELVGLSATQDRLFYLTDEASLPNAADKDPEHYSLWTLNIDTGASTLVATRVVRHTETGTTLVWSDDGRTLTYGRIDESADTLDPAAFWEFRAYADVFVWREGQGTIRSLGRTRGVPMLAPSGASVAFLPADDSGPHHVMLTEADSPVTSWSKAEFVVHRSSGLLVIRRSDEAKTLIVLDLETQEEVTIADGAEILGIEGDFGLYTVDGLLAAYDFKHRVAHVSSLAVPQSHSIFFDLDEEEGLAVAGLGLGVYANLYRWDLLTGEGSEIAMPEPRSPGGDTRALNARIQGGAIAYYPRAGWLDKDLWELRGDQHHHIARNVCADLALDGRSDRLLLTAEKGCSAAGALRRVSLYDPENPQLTDAGHDVKYVRQILSDGRVVLDFKHESGRELVLWDIAADTLTSLAVETEFGGASRRDGTWFMARFVSDGLSAYVIVHPGGISYGTFQGGHSGHVAVGEDVVVYVANGAEGDALVVTSWDALVAP